MEKEVGALTHKFVIKEVATPTYLTVGYSREGKLTRLFVEIGPKENVIVQGLLKVHVPAVNRRVVRGDNLATVLKHMKGYAETIKEYAPDSVEVDLAAQVTHYIHNWIDLKFGSESGKAEMSTLGEDAFQKQQVEQPPMVNREDAPPCTTCGSIMVTTSPGHYKCSNCGSTTSDEAERRKDQTGH